MPSRRWRSVAWSQCGRPAAFLVIFVRCGARMTQPVWPVQCSASRPASFSGRFGSPPLPKMLSTKSRLLTRLPGAKKRISIVFSGVKPGHFRADERAEQQRDETFRRLRLRGGERQAQQVARRIEGEAQHFCEDRLGHADLVVGNRQAAFGDVKNALGRAAVAARVVQHALFHAIGTEDAPK